MRAPGALKPRRRERPPTRRSRMLPAALTNFEPIARSPYLAGERLLHARAREWRRARFIFVADALVVSAFVLSSSRPCARCCCLCCRLHGLVWPESCFTCPGCELEPLSPCGVDLKCVFCVTLSVGMSENVCEAASAIACVSVGVTMSTGAWCCSSSCAPTSSGLLARSKGCGDACCGVGGTPRRWQTPCVAPRATFRLRFAASPGAPEELR